MKKFILFALLSVLLTSTGMGLSSCDPKNKKQTEQKGIAHSDTIASDIDGVLPEPAPLVVENLISTDRQDIYLHVQEDYKWFVTDIVLEDWLDSDSQDGTIASVTNIFQTVRDKGQGKDVYVWFYTHDSAGRYGSYPVEGMWMECFELNDEAIKLRFTDAYDRMMQANYKKPHSKCCVIRKPVGRYACNPQYIFGNKFSQIYVDATTGAVTDKDPAFFGSGKPYLGGPLGEWP